MLSYIKSMDDKRFMSYINNLYNNDIEVGDLVITTGFSDDDVFISNSTNGKKLNLSLQMKLDKKNKKVMAITEFDWEDDSFRLSNGYWYYAEYLSKI